MDSLFPEAGGWFAKSVHELSVAQSILEIVQQYVPQERAAALRAVKVRLGSLSGVVPESLDFCFGAMVAGTPWSGARLELERVAAACCCRTCGRSFEPADLLFLCPSCGGGDVQMISGSELQVVELGLDEEEARPA